MGFASTYSLQQWCFCSKTQLNQSAFLTTPFLFKKEKEKRTKIRTFQTHKALFLSGFYIKWRWVLLDFWDTACISPTSADRARPNYLINWKYAHLHDLLSTRGPQTPQNPVMKPRATEICNHGSSIPLWTSSVLLFIPLIFICWQLFGSGAPQSPGFPSNAVALKPCSWVLDGICPWRLLYATVNDDKK